MHLRRPHNASKSQLPTVHNDRFCIRRLIYFHQQHINYPMVVANHVHDGAQMVHRQHQQQRRRQWARETVAETANSTSISLTRTFPQFFSINISTLFSKSLCLADRYATSSLHYCRPRLHFCTPTRIQHIGAEIIRCNANCGISLSSRVFLLLLGLCPCVGYINSVHAEAYASAPWHPDYSASKLCPISMIYPRCIHSRLSSNPLFVSVRWTCS